MRFTILYLFLFSRRDIPEAVFGRDDMVSSPFNVPVQNIHLTYKDETDKAKEEVEHAHLIAKDYEKKLRRVEKEKFAAATISIEEIGDVSLVLDMSLNEKLISKGLARDIIRHVQAKRKELNLDVEALIELNVWIDSREQLFDNDW